MKELKVSTKIANNGTAKISAATGTEICITAVTSADSSAATVTFADDSDLGVLEVPAASTLNLTIPIRCASFTPSNAAISVVYYEEHKI